MDKKAQIKAVNQLGRHLKAHCDKILENKVPFVVDSALFWFISEAIQSLLSSDATLFPESNPEFYDYVMFLSDFFEQTPSLCIKGVNSIPGNLELSYFRKLSFLELRKIPPHMVTSLHTIKTNLRKIKCLRCLDSLSEILCPQHGVNNNNNNAAETHVPPSSLSISLVWPELKDIDFSRNRISEIDAKAIENFELTPSVENLNLSWNKIYSINDSFLRVLNSLKVLNLNYNQLKVIPGIPPNVKTLLIAHNYITSLTCSSFSSLKNLEILDLSANVIANKHEFDKLSELRFLKNLMLLGNPISCLESYRHMVCCNINRIVLTRTFVLDNKKLSVSEVRRALESTKQKKFVPFNVAPTPTPSSDSSSRPGTSEFIKNAKSLTQSYDSTCSSTRSSRKKKAKLRVPRVFDPDDEDTMSIDESEERCKKASGNASSSDTEKQEEKKGQKCSDSGSEKSDVAVGVKNAIEFLRVKYGEENWLLKQAGVEVGKLLKIPIGTPSANKMSALSQSLPGPGVFHKAYTSNSLYTTATEMEDSRVLHSSDTEDSAAPTKISTNLTTQKCISLSEDSKNNISDDSLIFYPCNSTTDWLSEHDKRSDEGEFFGNGLTKEISPEEFRFTQAVTPKHLGPIEYFEDPQSKCTDFHYFQNGQMHRLSILDNYLFEVDKTDSKVLAKWDLRSLETLTDEKVMTETDTVEFRLTFDTVKKNLRERIYIMTTKDFNKFEEALGPYIEFKTMQEFSEAFQCLKCNAQFSKGMADKTVHDHDGVVREVPICNNPDCRSELLVLLDSAPLPNNQSLNVESEIQPYGANGNTTPVSGNSTTAKPIFDLKFFRVPLASSTPKLYTSGFPEQGMRYGDLNPQQNELTTITEAAGKHSKASSEPTSLNALNNRSESDIETLSCTSSSIEVIANNGDSGSNSDIVEVPEAVELTVPELSQKSPKSPGVTMTDSTSSGSCAESVCTTYEKKGANSMDSSGNQQSHNSPSKISANMTSSFTNSYSSTVTLTNMAPSSPSHRLVTCPVRYDYENFSKVDHRLQLFCEISVFKGADEKLLALAKVLVICDINQYSGIVIFSNKKLYIYKIFGLEGDKPESWLQKVKSFSLDKLVGINVLIGRHGVGVDLQGKYYAFLFRDATRTSNFLECFLSDICCEMNDPPLVRDFSQTHKALLSPTNSVVYFGVLHYASCEKENTHAAAILLTDVEVLLITDLNWLGAVRDGSVVPSLVQKLVALRQVESHESDMMFVRLIFGSSRHTFWELYFDSVGEKQVFVSSLQPYAKGIPFISLSQPIDP